MVEQIPQHQQRFPAAAQPVQDAAEDVQRLVPHPGGQLQFAHPVVELVADARLVQRVGGPHLAQQPAQQHLGSAPGSSAIVSSPRADGRATSRAQLAIHRASSSSTGTGGAPPGQDPPSARRQLPLGAPGSGIPHPHPLRRHPGVVSAALP
ncbi:hypothetical protein M271_24080 [Streptomyces rapamycinicus NRRL 5491]|uniref:Uncharacterized protein n=1 Tax=Streptomyces rapamycinicus TaxID=1226757 RepID=A0ABR6LNI3_9ACTN|nr:hypothetical protein [Streptomyces rapamycinicus]AGP56311.1 hypothetical protein M271_24080 [Streptomyces rapamycinicus NRRL 5491]MBB4783907.1 hypothetical protein [Streptomyces rapamycinicus]